jgi:hypothetical protein
LWQTQIVSIAICDAEAFLPYWNLVESKLENVDELPEIERFLRTLLLHDHIAFQPMMRRKGTWYYVDAAGQRRADNPIDDESLANCYLGGPEDLDLPRVALPDVPEIQLSPALMELASRHAGAGPGSPYFEAHIKYLKRLGCVVQIQGSLHLCSAFGREAVSTASGLPETLFEQLDGRWQKYAKAIQRDGLGLLVPPVLGIVLSRCARRSAIEVVVRDLRDEWAGARLKVWTLLDALRNARTLGQAVEIRQNLADASRLFAPEPTEHDSRPVRILWEIAAASVAGAGIGALAGGSPVIGSITGAMAHVPRSVPALLHEFGPAIFGRGAFDLARRVRRAVSQIELDTLPRLLSDAERQKLGFR